MNPPTPMPMSSSASSTLTAAMIPSRTFVVSRFPIILLRRPAALRAAGDIVQRPPSLARDVPCLFDRAAHAMHLTQEVVELRLDLVADAAAVLCHVEPAPYTTGHGAEARRQEHSRSLVHIPLLRHTGRSQAARSYG